MILYNTLAYKNAYCVSYSLYTQTEARPTLSNENMLINELIREYLEFNNYKYTLSVLMTGII